MTDQERSDFIESIGAIVKRIAPEYGITICSPVIAQACLESAYGTSDKAQHHNYFGLKYRPNRVDCASGSFQSSSQEEENGQMVDIVTEWFAFDSMEDGVRGYFQFLDSVSNYDNLKGVTDPREYLENIKADHYATSSDYVDNNMRVIESNNLTRFDSDEVSDDNKNENQEDNKMSNSSMVTQTLLSPNCNSPRTQAISKITIHHTAGFATVDQYLRSFAREERQASANYIIGADGQDVGLCVEECDRAWTSSSDWNDNRAVTIEVTNDGGPETDWHVSDEALETLIRLCVDICQRNGIEKLEFTGDQYGSLTMHRFYSNTNCPGPYLGSKFPYICDRVNAVLNGDDSVVIPDHSNDSGDKSMDELVQEVLRGEWGNNPERNERLRAAGYNAAEVQAAVNAYLSNPDAGTDSVAPSGDNDSKKSLDDVVAAVLRGDYGNGEERKTRIEEDGYDYSEVQAAVNAAINGDDVDTGDAEPQNPDLQPIAQVAYDVYLGKWGNGDERRQRLEDAGYDYDEVQRRVNEIINGETSASPSITDKLVDAVIRGDYGNGDERRQRLEDAGYDYDEVQAAVNARY